MITIIKKGIPPKQYKIIYTTKCENCDCEFEFELEDCSRVERSLNGYINIECPCCKEKLERMKGYLKAREVEVTDD